MRFENFFYDKYFEIIVAMHYKGYNKPIMY